MCIYLFSIRFPVRCLAFRCRFRLFLQSELKITLYTCILTEQFKTLKQKIHNLLLQYEKGVSEQRHAL